ncbi:MAG TPA: ankyrin repeat domain-containing protein [Bacteroidales bacterium]|nr:ankyrin repeat domain-containing protein [Bacteroidales bacterium]
MSAARVLLLRVFLLETILLFSGNLNAQWSETDNLQELDTSNYIPVFYSGALEYNLMIASSEGYPSEIERLISKGADINCETEEGVTPLILAVSNNKLEAVYTLLSFNPLLNSVTSSYETPLLIAVKNRNFNITEALIRAGADIDFPDKHDATPLHFASIYGYLDIVDLLLYYDASIDLKSEEGTTPLLASVLAGHADITDLLIQNGANMEARDNDGLTPFLMASLYGDTLLMNLLYKKGVDIYTTNKSNHNALTLSIIGNHIEATKLLFKIGKKWSDSKDAINPYSVASKYHRKEVVNILESNNIPGHLKYGFDQIALTASSRLNFKDIYTGINISVKEPYLNAGFTAGCDMKLWYSRVLIQNTENIFYQYMDKRAIAYAGLFKDFILIDHPDRYNLSLSTSLLAGYSFGNKLKGTLFAPENKFMAIPSLSLKLIKMNFSLNMGFEYMNSEYYHYGPVWFRIGCAYNYFFDNVRTKVKTINWY